MSRPRTARPSGHEDRLLEAVGPGGQVVSHRYLRETPAPRLENPEEGAGSLSADHHIARVSGEGGRGRHVGVARRVVADIEAGKRSASSPGPPRELRDRHNRIRTLGKGRD